MGRAPTSGCRHPSKAAISVTCSQSTGSEQFTQKRDFRGISGYPLDRRSSGHNPIKRLLSSQIWERTILGECADISPGVGEKAAAKLVRRLLPIAISRIAPSSNKGAGSTNFAVNAFVSRFAIERRHHRWLFPCARYRMPNESEEIVDGLQQNVGF